MPATFFSPQPVSASLDTWELAPHLTTVVLHLAEDIRPVRRAEFTTAVTLGGAVPRNTIRWVAKETDLELAAFDDE